MSARKKTALATSNGKLALMLCVIAAFFFAAVIIKRMWFM